MPFLILKLKSVNIILSIHSAPFSTACRSASSCNSSLGVCSKDCPCHTSSCAACCTICRAFNANSLTSSRCNTTVESCTNKATQSMSCWWWFVLQGPLWSLSKLDPVGDVGISWCQTGRVHGWNWKCWRSWFHRCRHDKMDSHFRHSHGSKILTLFLRSCNVQFEVAFAYPMQSIAPTAAGRLQRAWNASCDSTNCCLLGQAIWSWSTVLIAWTMSCKIEDTVLIPTTNNSE